MTVQVSCTLGEVALGTEPQQEDLGFEPQQEMEAKWMKSNSEVKGNLHWMLN